MNWDRVDWLGVPNIPAFLYKFTRYPGDDLPLTLLYGTVGNSKTSTSGQLEEPLLNSADRSEDYGSAAHNTERDKARERSYGSHERTDRALVPHSINRINWEELWRLLWGNCCSSWAGIVGKKHTLNSCLSKLATSVRVQAS